MVGVAPTQISRRKEKVWAVLCAGRDYPTAPIHQYGTDQVYKKGFHLENSTTQDIIYYLEG